MTLLPSSADTEINEEVVVDHARTALLEALQSDLGDSLIEHVLVPGVDLTVRVAPDSWGDTAGYLREGQRFRFFDFLSAIDWLPSPFGRSMDAAVDAADDETNEPAEIVTGVAGGDTRFQLFARVFSLTTNIGLTLKTDVGDDLTMETWTRTYPGADWHEREVWEMFGINFAGHPGLRPLYLPTDFEGNPMRKDFPLLARMIKPWPGIVDVEPMPEPEEPDAPSLENVEAGDAPASETAVAEVQQPVIEEATPEPVPSVAPVGEETDAADIAGIPEHLLKRSREAKGDAS
ncbi:MAG: NADH-quinone oxidoreductase subunit C [Acidimicrobiales bacterium]